MKLKLALLAAITAVFIVPVSASAVTGADWQAGRIIDDGIMRSPSTMTPANIQQFLNNKMPVCDTWGEQPYAGTTRAEYGRARGNPPPYRCLKDYYENVDTKANNLEGRPIPAGAKSAAQIIYDYGQQYKINPQVLLVLLQKEQTLLTDDWPWTIQYKTATGYGCPDTAPCDAQYFGLSNQIRWASRMFQAIGDNDPNWYSPYIKGYNYIYWNPIQSCGGSPVTVANWSTASLYSYTPYQPNQAALNNLYGTGDGCSSYGNRNFWRLFNDWFGSTAAVNASVKITSSLTASGPLYKDAASTISYSVTNEADYPVDAGVLGICGRLNGQNADLGARQYTLQARQTVQVSYPIQPAHTGTIELFACGAAPGVGWLSGYPYTASGSIARSASLPIADNPLVTSGVSISPTNPVVGQPVTVTMKIHNAGASPVPVGFMAMAARDPHNRNVDFGGEDVTIPAGTTYTYSKTQTFTSVGKHTFSIVNFRNGSWNSTYPSSANNTIQRSASVNIGDNPTITSGITVSPATPAIGEPVTVSLTVRNSGTSDVNIGTIAVAARDPHNRNVDFGADNVTIPAGTTYTYSKTQTFKTPGQHTFFIANFRNGNWNSNYPSSSDSSVRRQLAVNLADSPHVASGITISNSPTLGQPVTISMTIRNTTTSPVNIGTMAIAVRDPSGKNVDLPADTNVTVPANGTYTYTKTQTFNTPGKYTLFIANFRNGSWDSNYPKSLSGSVQRTVNMNL